MSAAAAARGTMMVTEWHWDEPHCMYEVPAKATNEHKAKHFVIEPRPLVVVVLSPVRFVLFFLGPTCSLKRQCKACLVRLHSVLWVVFLILDFPLRCSLFPVVLEAFTLGLRGRRGLS